MKSLLPVLLAALCVTNARADVTSAGPGGFTVEHEVVVEASRTRVWQAAVREVGQWWNADHTVAGIADNMSIDLRPLGCFCEALPNGGGVAHLTVTFVSSGVLLRMTGALGPLGLMGVNGNMVWEFFDDESGTKVKFTYAVGGYRLGGLDSISVPVDYVIGDALNRLKAHAETSE